jgi:hypothetical protein
MTELAHTLPRTLSTWRLAIALLMAAGLAAAGTLAIVSLIDGRGQGTHSPKAHVFAAPGHAFAIAYPAGWQTFSQTQLRGVAGSPVMVLRRADRTAMIVARPSAAPANQPLAKLAAQLGSRLKGRFADFRPVGARIARTRAGSAFFYTFARTKTGVVQSILVTRVRGRTWTLYAVTRANAPAAARQAGSIMATFGP